MFFFDGDYRIIPLVCRCLLFLITNQIIHMITLKPGIESCFLGLEFVFSDNY